MISLILLMVWSIFHDFFTFLDPPKSWKIEKTRKTPLYESAHFHDFFEKIEKNTKKREIPSCPKYGGPAGYRQSLSKSGKISNEKIHLLKAPQMTSREPVDRESGWRLFFHFFRVYMTPDRPLFQWNFNEKCLIDGHTHHFNDFPT